VVSTLEACASGSFQKILSDTLEGRKVRAERVLLCSGKICYDLEQQREKLNRHDVAIVRIEQLYPFPLEMLRSMLSSYAEGTPAVWVQEEPENMGAWHYLRIKLVEKLFDRFPFSVVCRPESASTATGSAASHRREQEELMAAAFGTYK
jgi:2-oxoglutarate dehydrogenase E1 component